MIICKLWLQKRRMVTMNKDQNLFDEIARVAYGLYEKRGYSHGSDIDDWTQAERIVMKKYAKGIEKDVKALKSTPRMKTAPRGAHSEARPR
jgi:hypothetical protein